MRTIIVWLNRSSVGPDEYAPQQHLTLTDKLQIAAVADIPLLWGLPWRFSYCVDDGIAVPESEITACTKAIIDAVRSDSGLIGELSLAISSLWSEKCDATATRQRDRPLQSINDAQLLLRDFTLLECLLWSLMISREELIDDVAVSFLLAVEPRSGPAIAERLWLDAITPPSPTYLFSVWELLSQSPAAAQEAHPLLNLFAYVDWARIGDFWDAGETQRCLENAQTRREAATCQLRELLDPVGFEQVQQYIAVVQDLQSISEKKDYYHFRALRHVEHTLCASSRHVEHQLARLSCVFRSGARSALGYGPMDSAMVQPLTSSDSSWSDWASDVLSRADHALTADPLHLVA